MKCVSAFIIAGCLVSVFLAADWRMTQLENKLAGLNHLCEAQSGYIGEVKYALNKQVKKTETYREALYMCGWEYDILDKLVEDINTY